MKRTLRVLLISTFFLVTSGVFGAEQTGNIRGKITDENGESLPGVTVTATSPNLQGIRAAISDRNGYFRLPLLPVGTYTLTFELSGFAKLTLTGNDVRPPESAFRAAKASHGLSAKGT